MAFYKRLAPYRNVRARLAALYRYGFHCCLFHIRVYCAYAQTLQIMPIVTTATINEIIGTISLKSEFALPAQPFIAVSIVQNAYGAKISGVEFGIDYTLGTLAQSPTPLGVTCVAILVENLTPNPTIDIKQQIGATIGVDFPFPNSKKVRYVKFLRGASQAVDDDFTSPIEIQAGNSFAFVVYAASLPVADAADSIIRTYCGLRGALNSFPDKSILRS